MHDFLLPFQWNGHPFRRALMRHHHFDLRAESFFVELERRFAISVVVEIRIDLHGLLLEGRVSSLAYFSVSFFRLARPASKSLPIMLSMPPLAVLTEETPVGQLGFAPITISSSRPRAMRLMHAGKAPVRFKNVEARSKPTANRKYFAYRKPAGKVALDSLKREAEIR